MEVSEEDHIDFDIQNDAVYECEVRFVVKKSQTSDKNFYNSIELLFTKVVRLIFDVLKS